MRVADGGGDFEVEFEAFTGTAQKVLSLGKVAYIGTGHLSFYSFHLLEKKACQLQHQR